MAHKGIPRKQTLLETGLTYFLTYCMKHNPSGEANSSSATQEIPRIL
jgi:hypothetical protein